MTDKIEYYKRSGLKFILDSCGREQKLDTYDRTSGHLNESKLTKINKYTLTGRHWNTSEGNLLHKKQTGGATSVEPSTSDPAIEGLLKYSLLKSSQRLTKREDVRSQNSTPSEDNQQQATKRSSVSEECPRFPILAPTFRERYNQLRSALKHIAPNPRDHLPPETFPDDSPFPDNEYARQLANKYLPPASFQELLLQRRRLVRLQNRVPLYRERLCTAQRTFDVYLVHLLYRTELLLETQHFPIGASSRASANRDASPAYEFERDPSLPPLLDELSKPGSSQWPLPGIPSEHLEASQKKQRELEERVEQLIKEKERLTKEIEEAKKTIVQLDEDLVKAAQEKRDRERERLLYPRDPTQATQKQTRADLVQKLQREIAKEMAAVEALRAELRSDWVPESDFVNAKRAANAIEVQVQRLEKMKEKTEREGTTWEAQLSEIFKNSRDELSDRDIEKLWSIINSEDLGNLDEVIESERRKWSFYIS